MPIIIIIPVFLYFRQKEVQIVTIIVYCNKDDKDT